jgi:DNA polymerase
MVSSNHDSSDPRYESARLLRQRLELDRAFGWDVPISPPRRRAVVAKAAPVPAAVPAAVQAPASDEIARREGLLEPIRAQVRGCTACDLCRQGRKQTVFGVGSPCARVMFVGEAPGAEEDRRGEPFVGPAGRLLTDIITKGMGLRREDVYIANVIKCRPPGNRTPDATEMATCRAFLRRQIDIIQPEVLVALGAVAARGLLETELSVGRLRGSFHDYEGRPLRVTYHPAYLLRSPHEKRKTWEDIQAVLRRIGLEPPSRRG